MCLFILIFQRLRDAHQFCNPQVTCACMIYFKQEDLDCYQLIRTLNFNNVTEWLHIKHKQKARHSKFTLYMYHTVTVIARNRNNIPYKHKITYIKL